MGKWLSFSIVMLEDEWVKFLDYNRKISHVVAGQVSRTI